jgi:hypothetical protein
MARWVRWDAHEFLLLIELVEREGFNPRPESIERLRQELQRWGAGRTERAFEPNYRSPASIGSQIHRLSLLMRDDPRAEQETPAAMREAWLRHLQVRKGMRHEPLIETPAGLRAVPPRRRSQQENYKEDRRDLAIWLDELHALLRSMIEHGAELVGQHRAEEFRRAWKAIEERRPLELAGELLERPEVEDDLETFGLVGPPLKLKLAGFRRSVRKLFFGFTWTNLKPALKWANVVLGSLTHAMPFIDPVKEFKESWEAAAEEAYEPLK